MSFPRKTKAGARFSAENQAQRSCATRASRADICVAIAAREPPQQSPSRENFGLRALRGAGAAESVAAMVRDLVLGDLSTHRRMQCPGKWGSREAATAVGSPFAFAVGARREGPLPCRVPALTRPWRGRTLLRETASVEVVAAASSGVQRGVRWKIRGQCLVHQLERRVPDGVRISAVVDAPHPVLPGDEASFCQVSEGQLNGTLCREAEFCRQVAGVHKAVALGDGGHR